jgi:biopolymer transport protein ExbD
MNLRAGRSREEPEINFIPLIDVLLVILIFLMVGDAKEPVVVINADANATHQSVIHVMEAARQAGLIHITFATQTPVK